MRERVGRWIGGLRGGRERVYRIRRGMIGTLGIGRVSGRGIITGGEIGGGRKTGGNRRGRGVGEGGDWGGRNKLRIDGEVRVRVGVGVGIRVRVVEVGLIILVIGRAHVDLLDN